MPPDDGEPHRNRGRHAGAAFILETIAFMPAHAVEPRRLYRQIADRIGVRIRSGEYSPGERLPAERELARQLHVSRPSLREALIALEVQGYVEVRIGSGIYVRDRHERAAARRSAASDAGPFELMRARGLVETECAALAARNATRAQVAAIRKALKEMARANRDGRDPRLPDRLFHLRIAEATGNSALVLMVQSLWDQRLGTLFSRLDHHFARPATQAQAIREHRRIVAAIAAGDARGARRAMRDHIEETSRRYSKGWVNGSAGPDSARARRDG
jgi:DNA-binding FadR family transcriptional regulator